MPDGTAEPAPGRTARAAAVRAADLLEVLLRPGEPDAGRVAEVLRAHGEREPLELTAPDLAELREAALAIREVFAAPDTHRAAATLNSLLTAHARPPRLTTHGGEHPWHLHADAADDGPWGRWLITSSCLALAVLLADRQEPPGGLCASAPCGRPFVTGGNGSPRKYCSPRCATRERVAAHRRAKRN
ncbi:hypothetical protein CFN78_04805 [Amycolatopsis antarctica]|uniref:Zinc finger CGNR domain-containing protein n=1 Tax=Amycolatopsis antarctica TaxID=1854586 RepID=A0A263D7T2_9PSEU|nr:CGNR zinc finger domain-containing protein [Amycolatopsis antarctica]OZM74441.1 hypothetical protein CFN78_04805 [Amycolatopsis antarctica]